MRRVGRAVWPVVAAVLVAGFLFVAVFPTATYLDQRDATHRATEHLAVLGEENAALERRVAELHDEAEIERLAREHYGLVRPGEEAFAVLPPPAPTTTVPPSPEPGADGPEGGGSLLARAWDGLRDLL